MAQPGSLSPFCGTLAETRLLSRSGNLPCSKNYAAALFSTFLQLDMAHSNPRWSGELSSYVDSNRVTQIRCLCLLQIYLSQCNIHSIIFAVDRL